MGEGGNSLSVKAAAAMLGFSPSRVRRVRESICENMYAAVSNDRPSREEIASQEEEEMVDPPILKSLLNLIDNPSSRIAAVAERAFLDVKKMIMDGHFEGCC